ncbi:hypothetical protein [Streptomyces chrestomyceticus]|uniref:hypothetical protein n=1 Tax=Streptomyces chrestomyceticus TaxID=68185 RepID=UPI00340A0AD7
MNERRSVALTGAVGRPSGGDLVFGDGQALEGEGDAGGVGGGEGGDVLGERGEQVQARGIPVAGHHDVHRGVPAFGGAAGGAAFAGQAVVAGARVARHAERLGDDRQLRHHARGLAEQLDAGRLARLAVQPVGAGRLELRLLEVGDAGEGDRLGGGLGVVADRFPGDPAGATGHATQLDQPLVGALLLDEDVVRDERVPDLADRERQVGGVAGEHPFHRRQQLNCVIAGPPSRLVPAQSLVRHRPSPGKAAKASLSLSFRIPRRSPRSTVLGRRDGRWTAAAGRRRCCA